MAPGLEARWSPAQGDGRAPLGRVQWVMVVGSCRRVIGAASGALVTHPRGQHRHLLRVVVGHVQAEERHAGAERHDQCRNCRE